MSTALPVAPRQYVDARLRAPAGTGEAEPAARSGRSHLLWRPMREGTVHVIGAGLAGLSAAVRLTAAGAKTVVHEAAAAAGGRCKSFFDPSFGAEIDNGNHLILSGNRAALDYLARIGSSERLSGPAPRSSTSPIFERANAGGCARMRDARPGGCSTGRGGRRERRCTSTLRRSPSSGRLPARQSSARCAARGPLYERLWRPLLLAGLNTEPQESSALLAGALLRGTLGGGGKACRPLIALEGLSPTFVDPAIRFIAGGGGTVRLGDRLRDIRFAADRAVALEFEFDSIVLGREDAAIVAVPPWAARLLLPGVDAPEEFRGIVNAHFLAAAPKSHPPILGVIGGLTQWLFVYRDRLSVTISAAGDLIDWSREALAESIWREVAELTGLARDPPAVADRQGEAGDLRRDAGAGRQAPAFAGRDGATSSSQATGSRPACQRPSKGPFGPAARPRLSRSRRPQGQESSPELRAHDPQRQTSAGRNSPRWGGGRDCASREGACARGSARTAIGGSSSRPTRRSPPNTCCCAISAARRETSDSNV